ncbi:MAG: hypothetical protein RL748_3059 [Pseudomonadota bacterium]|jgi:FdhD protein
MPASASHPLLSCARLPLTHPIRALDEQGRAQELMIPAERALTLYLDKRELVTLMTLGSEPESLVLGYLKNQRLVRDLSDVIAVQVDWEVAAAAIATRGGGVEDIEQRTARRVVTSGCGQGSMFGGLMDEIDTIQLSPSARLQQSTLYTIVDTIRSHPSVYKQAGSVHACALFSADGCLIYFIEDVGRHNAVDAIAGKMWLAGMDGADKVFYTTGRLTSEMVIKGAQMGIPFLLSRSGTTQMGHQVAQQLGMTLIARCSGRHFLLLSQPQRLIAEPGLAQIPAHPAPNKVK